MDICQSKSICVRVVILRIETLYFGSDQNLLEKCRKRSLYLIGDDDS